MFMSKSDMLDEFESAESRERTTLGHDENVDALSFTDVCVTVIETDYVSSYDMW